MSMDRARRTVALLGPVPQDVQDALKDDFLFLPVKDWADLPAEARTDLRLGLTSAMGGASAELLVQLPGLCRIASVGAGIDRFDLDWLQGRGITLSPTPEVMTEDTADCAVALLFASLRNIVPNDRLVRSGAWAGTRAPLGMRPSAARVGIIGLGRIGSRIADKLSAFGCSIAYTGRKPKDVSWRFEPDLLALARDCDVLIFSCAGGEETRHLVNAELLQALGPDGYLINVSRGSVVDENALIAALEERRIAGAALDVFENEPTPDSRFLALENCILSPHAAVYTRQNRVDLIARIREILQAPIPGGPPA